MIPLKNVEMNDSVIYVSAFAIVVALSVFGICANWRGNGVMKYAWCVAFHRKSRHRTGKRNILRVSIWYEVICNKCGIEDEEVEWVL